MVVLDINKIWAGYIYNINIDLAKSSITFDIGVHENLTTNFYNLIFKDIIEFDYSSVEGFNYYYIDITDIFLTKGNYLKFDIVLWDEHNMLTINCHDYTLTLLPEQVLVGDSIYP